MRARRVIEWLWLVSGLAFAWVASRRYAFILDDSFISLRYARNLIEGHGLVFNPGLPPVEGYTNFLWVLLEAAHLPFARWPENWLLFYNVLFGLLVVAVVWLETIRRGPSARSWAWLAVLLVCANETLHAWMGGGLETTLFMALVTLGVGRFLREEFHGAGGVLSSWPIGLSLLTRPEGYLVGGLCAVASHVHDVESQGQDRRRRIRWISICATLALPHLAFRRLYYGEWLPNTFFVKIPGPYFESGLPYVLIFCRAFYVSWLLVAGLLLLALFDCISRKELPLSRDRGVLATIIAGWFAYVAYAGGDHFEFRLLAPTVPLLALLVAWTAADRLSRPDLAAIPGARWWLAAGVVCGLVLGAWSIRSATTLAFADDLFRRLRIPSAEGLAREDYAEAWRPAGQWLRRFGTGGERISVPAAGVIPWESRLVTLDTHGLNDREIGRRPITQRGVLAHEKSATWEDVLRFGVTFHLDDLGFRESPQAFPPAVARDESRIVVELPNHLWMNFASPGASDALRQALRERGAIVAPGPGEVSSAVEARNERNRESFEGWCREVADEKRQRRSASLVRLRSRPSS